MDDTTKKSEPTRDASTDNGTHLRMDLVHDEFGRIAIGICIVRNLQERLHPPSCITGYNEFVQTTRAPGRKEVPDYVIQKEIGKENFLFLWGKRTLWAFAYKISSVQFQGRRIDTYSSKASCNDLRRNPSPCQIPYTARQTWNGPLESLQVTCGTRYIGRRPQKG